MFLNEIVINNDFEEYNIYCDGSIFCILVGQSDFNIFKNNFNFKIELVEE